jgi:tetratricopeptide (TPR) repeat protein
MALKRTRTCVLFCCCAVLMAAALPAVAAKLDGVKQLSAKARQLLAAHDDQGARAAYLEAVAALDALSDVEDKEVAEMAGTTYFELATLDEKMGRNKDAEADYLHAFASSLPLGAGRGYKVISASLQRQQVLYMRDGDFEHAAEAASREVAFYDLLRGRNAPLSPAAANAQLPPTLVLAKCYLSMKKLDAAKEAYDRAWVMAETAGIPPPGTLDELYSGSVALYGKLHLTAQINAAQKRLAKLKEIEAQQATIIIRAAPSSTAIQNN